MMKETIQKIEALVTNGGFTEPQSHRILGLALIDVMQHMVRLEKCAKRGQVLLGMITVVAVPYMLWSSVVVFHAMISTGWNPW